MVSVDSWLEFPGSLPAVVGMPTPVPISGSDSAAGTGSHPTKPDKTNPTHHLQTHPNVLPWSEYYPTRLASWPRGRRARRFRCEKAGACVVGRVLGSFCCTCRVCLTLCCAPGKRRARLHSWQAHVCRQPSAPAGSGGGGTPAWARAVGVCCFLHTRFARPALWMNALLIGFHLVSKATDSQWRSDAHFAALWPSCVDLLPVLAAVRLCSSLSRPLVVSCTSAFSRRKRMHPCFRSGSLAPSCPGRL